MKKFSIVLLFSVWAGIGVPVYANLYINEIMYDVSGADSISSKSREWIEIYNDGTDISVDASKWRVYDGSANRTINGEENFTIPGGAYVILAGDKDTFLTDNAGFSGTVYDTGITSLNNSGATIKILDENGNPLDSVAYSSSQGGAGDGNSIQKVSGSWSGANPTPGRAHQGASASTNNDQNTNTNPDTSSSGGGESSSASSSSSSSPQKTGNHKIKAEIRSKPLVFAGVPFAIEGKAYGKDGEQAYSGKYFWNFGDGDSREIKVINVDKFEHTYFYPGDYTIILEYYAETYDDYPLATEKLLIKAVAPEVYITATGGEADFFIEITNNSDYPADLSGWSLMSESRIYKFPKNTTINSGKTLRLSSKLTGFSFADKPTLGLYTPTMDKISRDSVKSLARPAMPRNNTVSRIAPTKMSEKVEPETPSLALLSASAGYSEESKKFSYDGIVFYSMSALFIGVSAYAVYSIRKRHSSRLNPEDFELLDE